MKTCAKCGETKPLEAFVRDKRCKGGRAARCKRCTNEAQRRRYVENGYRATQRRYEARNQARIQVNNRQRNQRWRAANPERARELGRRSRAVLAAKDPDYHRRWYLENIERERRNGLNRAHARRALQGPTPPELAAYMAELRTQPCAYCESTENITIDHVVPLSRGGKHEASNLAPACQRCNLSKGGKLLSEWSAQIKQSLS